MTDARQRQRVSHLHARLLASSRPNSEDRAKVLECGDDLVAVVADGAGGLRGGCNSQRSPRRGPVRAAVHDASFDVRDPARWAQLLVAVDVKLSTTMTGETTGVVVVLSVDGVVGVSAGDSEAWIVEPTAIDDLTSEQGRVRLQRARHSRRLQT